MFVTKTEYWTQQIGKKVEVRWWFVKDKTHLYMKHKYFWTIPKYYPAEGVTFNYIHWWFQVCLLGLFVTVIKTRRIK